MFEPERGAIPRRRADFCLGCSVFDVRCSRFIMTEPRIRTTTVGSYPIPDWLAALPSEQARLDATRVIFDIQRQAGIDLPTDGELYRFDVNHPDTNGMIEYFIRPMAG